jgi:predicted metal-dependent phosphoesterase TrpH
MTNPAPMSRADLHVHSKHSRASGSVRFLRSRDCYSDPVAVYDSAKRRGMTIVTITDHDSIDGCLELLSRRPDAADVLIGEEVSCWVPDTTLEIHLGVYGLTEAIHAELQPLRRNVFEVMACLHATRTFFALNHPFHFFREQIPLRQYVDLMAMAPAVEVRNGTMLRRHNEFTTALWARVRGDAAPVVAGSDAHTLRRIGRTWIEAPGATASEFLDSLRAGKGRAGGDHGDAWTVASDAYGVIGRFAASIYGSGPRDHRGWHRALCAAFVAISPPAQFLPLAIAAKRKMEEGRVVDQAAAALPSDGASFAYVDPRA